MIYPEIFYLHIHGEQLGPYSSRHIDHLLNSGLIAEETLYWREGLEQWQPVTTLVQLRRRKRPWLKTVVIVSVLLLLAIIAHFFASVALLGWREASQHEYTARAAYWRARGIVRSTAFAPGAVLEFGAFSDSKVELQPPNSATVQLRAQILDDPAHERTLSWTVPMQFDAGAREWNGGPARESAP